jgi:CDP-diacylglycerol--serine O-phosphatidyltransferase
MPVIQGFSRANLVTYLGIIAAAVGIIWCTADSLLVAVLCLIVAGTCDMFDGSFARLFQRSERARDIGVQLDSLADAVSFVALPIAILARFELPIVAMIVVASLYALAGVTRLAFFNAYADPNTPISHYRGIPVTMAALVLPVMWLIPTTTQELTGWLWLGGMALLCVGFIIDVKVPKPTKKSLIGFAVLAVMLLALVTWVGLS